MASTADHTRVATLLGERKPAEAEAVCRQILSQARHDAAALHLLGLARKDQGDVVDGERLLRESIALAPGNAEFRTNLANLLRRLRRFAEAEREYRDALSISPGNRSARLSLARTLIDLGQHAAAEPQCRELIAQRETDAEAWNTLAMSLRGQLRLAEAEAAYRKALEINPSYGVAHHNLGSLLSQVDRAEESLVQLTRAQALGVQGFELELNRGRALTQLYRPDEAEQAFATAVALNPRHTEAQLNLASLRFMRGDPDFARDIAAFAAADPGTPAQLLHATVLWRAGDLPAAESVLRKAMTTAGADPDTRNLLAQILLEGGRLKDAEYEAAEAAAARPGDPSIVENLVTILLSRGHADDAMRFVQMQRSQAPFDQRWIAFEATAARLMGTSAYQELYDYERFVQVYDLDPPPGFSSIEEFNAELLRVLGRRHVFTTHPLDQSLRNGSQTARSLLTEPSPVIQAILRTFAAPLDDYQRRLGTDAEHPLSRRNTGSAVIAGAWSVQLRCNGFHVNHVHPHGWISSAYYVAVPDEVEDRSAMSGWLKFGEPRYSTPRAAAETFVLPRAGRLVLFPSYMWHGTNPIHGSQMRTTIAFDAVPQRP